MATEHPDAPQQFGIRLSAEIMEMVSAIQQFRQSNNQSTTLSAIVEDALEVYYEDLVESGEIQDEPCPLPYPDLIFSMFWHRYHQGDQIHFPIWQISVLMPC